MTSSGDTAPSSSAKQTSNRRQPFPAGFRESISTGWVQRDEPLPPTSEMARYAAARRDKLSAAFPGDRVVIAAGGTHTRSNDTDFPYRPHTAFTHLTGWGAHAEPDSILVFDPIPSGGHHVTLYFRERADRLSEEFYADANIGEFWIGPRPSLAQVASELDINTAHLSTFVPSDGARTVDGDDDLGRFVSELRLVKDDAEIVQLQHAVQVTGCGFDDIVANLPRIIEHPRGERVVEGIFQLRAHSDGNTVGYDTIAAAGAHACYLHWTRNDGPVKPGDLILIDAGVELDSLYTADITRTIPASGTFTSVQRRVYEAVREAADAGFAAAVPGAKFRAVHEAAMGVIAARVAEWGLLPVTADEALHPETGGQHRRYMVHGISHHLGLDVHDCAAARREMYYDGELTPGMVFTIEPGLYFQTDDLTVPSEYRGIGVRIEDNVLMTETGPVNLSADIPRTADQVEAWLARLR